MTNRNRYYWLADGENKSMYSSKPSSLFDTYHTSISEWLIFKAPTYSNDEILFSSESITTLPYFYVLLLSFLFISTFYRRLLLLCSLKLHHIISSLHACLNEYFWSWYHQWISTAKNKYVPSQAHFSTPTIEWLIIGSVYTFDGISSSLSINTYLTFC